MISCYTPRFLSWTCSTPMNILQFLTLKSRCRLFINQHHHRPGTSHVDISNNLSVRHQNFSILFANAEFCPATGPIDRSYDVYIVPTDHTCPLESLTLSSGARPLSGKHLLNCRHTPSAEKTRQGSVPAALRSPPPRNTFQENSRGPKQSLMTVKNMSEVLEVVGKMTQLESLELGEMINVTETHVIQGFSQLTNLKRLRLKKGQQDCPTNAIMQTISKLPSLNHLELINFDSTKGFEAFLGKCSNISTSSMMLKLVPINAIQVTDYNNST
ncbi:hypothetical protein J6590_022690 [Homalodisca vitripennis]|nr:hypothetical protein J6590_022690 [Homalodisca vitripennis]